MYAVVVKKKVAKGLKLLPENVRDRFAFLLHDLKYGGPVQPSWMNYWQLGGGDYHCHLTYHYVACWHCENESITIEVYYVGSREGAPY